MTSIKPNRQFQVTKLLLNFYGISIRLTNVNNILILKKNPTCGSKKASKVFNVLYIMKLCYMIYDIWYNLRNDK